MTSVQDWSFQAPAGGGLTTVNVWSGEAVDAISFVAQTPDGRNETSSKFGGDGGGQAQIVLDWPREYLTGISGTTNTYYNVRDVTTSLEFTTNLGRTIGPFGTKNGTPFALTISKGTIVGFHGRNTQYLNGIGVIVSA